MCTLLKIEFDDRELQEQLGSFQNDIDYIKKRITAKILSLTKKDVQKGLKGQFLKKDTGYLYKSIKYKAFPGGIGSIRAGAFYASNHENGIIEIHPRKRSNKYLVFQINGEWKKVSLIHLPKRVFFGPTVQQGIDRYTSEYEVDKLLQKILEGYFKKHGLSKI